MSKLLRRIWQLLKRKEVRSQFTVQSITEDSEKNMSKAASEQLKELGYAFNQKGSLRKIDKETNELTDKKFEFDVFNGDRERNQEHYEKIADLMPDIIYELVEKEDLHRLYIPFNAPKDESTFIFTYPKELKKPKKLVVLIHGSGYVRAGQWARSLIINHSLEQGSQIPYIKQAKELGYSVIVTNTNDVCRMVDGKRVPLPKVGSPEEHAFYVWENVVMPCEPEVVAIIAHSYGGTVARKLAEKFPKYFKEKVACIALTDSSHYFFPKTGESNFKDIACNWISGKEPAGTEKKPAEDGSKQVSAGHDQHEWTSWSAQSSIFKFMEEKCEKFLAAKETE